MRNASKMIDELFDEGTLAMSDRLVGLFDLEIWEPEDYDNEELQALSAAERVRGAAQRR